MSQLGDAIGGSKRVIGGPFGSKLTTRDYSDCGVPVIRGSNMEFDGRWIGGDYAYVSPEKKEKDLRSNLAKPGDIIVTQRGTLGQVSIVPDEATFEEFVVSQSQMAISVDPKAADRDFVYYYLRSPDFADYSETQTIQTGVPHINLGILREAPTDWPQLPEQREIAGVLGALDDKIEANRKASACLEEMARALYRSWFVTFDPVHAKSQNRPHAHMPPPTAALFPDRVGENGLPEGWVAGTVGDLLTLQRGFDLPKKERTDGAFPVLAAGGHHGTHKEFKVRGPGVTTGRSGVIGEVFLVLDDFWPLNTSLWVKDFIRCSPYFAYFLLQTLDLKALNSGSAVPSLNRNNVHNLSVDLPPERLIAAFDELAGPMFERVRHITIENQTLATLRDALLPRLMSGTLRVKAAEAEVEAVV